MKKLLFFPFYRALFLYLSFSFALLNPAFSYQGEDLGYIDSVIINGVYFEDLSESTIIFYPEDLINGEVVIRGILEPEQKKIPLENLAVEITLDGANSWIESRGNADWVVKFRPEIEKEYRFGIRVVEKTKQQDQPPLNEKIHNLLIDQFTLIASAELEKGYLSGKGIINTGFLNYFIPQSLKADPKSITDAYTENYSHLTDGIEVLFTNLKLDKNAKKIVSGEITKDISFDAQITENLTISIRTLHFSPSGSKISGKIIYKGQLDLPPIPFSGLSFNPNTIKGLINYIPKGGRHFPVVTGMFNAGLVLNKLSLSINTSDLEAKIKDMDIALKFGDVFGKINPIAVNYDNGNYKWGSLVSQTSFSLKIPGTGIIIENPGGTIQSSLEALTFTGKIKIPSYEGNFFELDLKNISDLKLNQNGISSLKRISISKLEKNYNLGGLNADIKNLLLNIKNNIPQGEIKGSLELAKIAAGAKINYSASIGAKGIENIKADINEKKTISVPSFADIILDSASISYGSGKGGGLKVLMDGSIKITNPSLKSLKQDFSSSFTNVKNNYYSNLGKTEVSDIVSGSRSKTSGLKQQIDKASSTTSDFVFRELSVTKTKISLPQSLSGWHSFSTPMSAKINSMDISALSWGIGSDAKGLWAGIKGSVKASGDLGGVKGSASAKFYSDGSFDLLDFEANASFKIGEFILHTDASVSDGKITGSGKLQSLFQIPSLPDSMKNADGNLNLDVMFSNLEIDSLENSIKSGIIEVPADFSLTFDYGDIKFSKFTISPDSALAQAKFYFKGLEGIEGVNLSGISISSHGIKGNVSYNPKNPVYYSFFTPPYNLTAVFKSFDIKFDSSDMSLELKNLNAYIQTGEAFDSKKFDLGFKDNLLAWGSNAKETGLEYAKNRLKIPGGLFEIENPGGLLSVQDKTFELTGKIQIPGIEDFYVDIPKSSPLKISSQGISTNSKIVLDELVKNINFEGFPALVKNFSLEIDKNKVDASFASSITLENFGNIKLDIKAELGNQGIKSISLDSQMPSIKSSIENFGEISISNLGAGYSEKGFSFRFDSDITITNPAISGSLENFGSSPEQSLENNASQVLDQAKSIALKNISLYKDMITIPDNLNGWHELSSKPSATIQGINLVLNEWGAGTEGNKLWVGLKGSGKGSSDSENSSASGDASLTAQFFTDGTFRILDFDFAGEFKLGPFRLLTDASMNGGKISGSGKLVSDTPFSDEVLEFFPSALVDPRKKTLDAGVSFSDLVVNEAEKIISDGIIRLEQSFDINIASLLDMNISSLGFSSKGISLDGLMNIPKTGLMVSLPNFEFKDINLGLNGFSGISEISTSFQQPFNVSIIESLGINLKLNSLGLKINWDNPGTGMFSFNEISGYLDFGTLFEETESLKNQALEFADNALKIEIPELKIPSTDISIKSVAAKINTSGTVPKIEFDTSELNLPFYDEILKIRGNNLLVDTSGLRGEFSIDGINSSLSLESLGFNANLKNFMVKFENTFISEGSFDIGLKLDKFFSLAFDVSGRVSMDGIKDLGLKMDQSQIPKVNAFDIAEVSLNSLEAGYTGEDGLYFNIEPVFDIKYSVLSSLENLTLKDVKVFKDRISAQGASLSQSLENVGFELGPAEVDLKKAGLSVSENDIEFLLDGNIKLADLCSADASIGLNKSGLSLEAIELSYEKPGIGLGGLLEWSDGNFRSAVNMAVADVFNFDGDITIGRNKTPSSSFSYWKVEIIAPAMIPLAPLPVNIYRIGGGLAYHMKAQTGENPQSPVTFIPDGGTNFTFIANTQVGTTDNGFTWHGDFKLIVDPENFHIIFRGDSYVLCTKEQRPDERKLSATIETGSSPMLFQISASALLEEKKGSVNLFRVSGMFDILFSANDWHIHVGTKENRLSVSAIEHIFSGSGYVMIDSSGLMLGVSKEFDVGDSIACFYGRLYGGASLDLIASVRPFFIDAEGNIWVGVEAGVKAFGEKFEIINAYGSLAMKIRCPDPTYVKIKAVFKYSFLSGLVSGTYKMTFWMPEKPEEAKSDKISFPLVSFLSPEDNASEVSRISRFELNTSLPIDEVFRLDNGNKYVLRIIDVVQPSVTSIGPAKIYKYINIEQSSSVYNAISITDSQGRNLPKVVGGLRDVDTIQIQSFDQLKRNHNYTIKAQAHLIKVKDSVMTGKIDFSSIDFKNVIADLEYEEPAILNKFTTADTDDLATAREIIESVYPNYSSPVVYPDTEIRVYYRVPAQGQQISLTNRHYVLDPLKNTIVSPEMWNQGLGTTDEIMATQQWIKFVKPQNPLTPVTVWTDMETGEQKPSLFSNGQEQNPFVYQETTPAEAGQTNITSQTQNFSMYNTSQRRAVRVSQESSENQIYALSDQPLMNIPQIQSNGTENERYEKKQLSTYYIQIKDEADEKIVYQNRFDVTSTGQYSGNSDIIESMAVDGASAGNDPYNIKMIINSIYGEDTRAIEEYEQRHQAFKDELMERFMKREFLYPCNCEDCDRPQLPQNSVHYYDDDRDEHIHQTENCMTGGCGYGGTCTYCYPRTTYDFGYEPPDEQSMPYFSQILKCQDVLKEYEIWLFSNQSPRDYHSFGTPEDIMFYFDTEYPLNWDALNIKFEINFTNSSVRDIVVDRNQYTLLSQPDSLNHAVRIPLMNLLSNEQTSEYHNQIEHIQNNTGAALFIRATLGSVESTQSSDGSITIKSGKELNRWYFQLRKGIDSEYPCTKCQSYGYGASHCYDTTCYNYTDPHFVLYDSGLNKAVRDTNFYNSWNN